MPARLRDIPLPALAWTTVGVVGGALALIFFYAPIDADQGLTQKIFYIHVPLALTSYACFGWGAWKALSHLRTRAPNADLESYAAIHQGVIFGALTLVTGSIWARTSWGIWWTWSSNQLVTFLILFLFYSAYFMLRYSVEPGPARANMCAVYALFGVVLIPVSWLSIRLANDFIHPTVFTSHGPQMSTAMFATFCVSWFGLLLLAGTMYRVELAGKRLDARLRELRELLGT
ncbi:MAG TPA: cytochrome c biogenesis protein [Gaiellaceae bacterium]|nr:cytochrome c biogenesis protein [Gaiellaceae bacterium]